MPQSEDRVTVAIDARVLAGQRAGKGRYLLGILEGWQAIAPDDYLRLYVEETLPVALPQTWVTVPVPPRIRGSQMIARDALAEQISVILSPASYSLAVVSRVPTVSVVHDIAVFRCPEAKPHWTTWLSERLFLATALRRSSQLIAVSDFTKQELVRYFHTPPEKISVAPNATHSQFRPRSTNDPQSTTFRQRFHLPRSFLLVVGTLEPRKNLLRLFDAFESLPLSLQHDFPLVVVGKIGWSAGLIVKRLHFLEKEGKLLYLEYLADDDLARMYNLAHAVIYPSLYEGFGLPALEAMASGAPLLTSQSSSLPEVVGAAALTVDPRDLPALTAGLQRIITDRKLREALMQRGLRQARQFRWEESARLIRTVLQAVGHDAAAVGQP